MTPTQTKLYCGECPFFRYEDTDGEGQCAVDKQNRYCGFRCCFAGGHYPEEMTPAHALRILHHYQKWRRGGKIGGQPSPAILGMAIDAAIRVIRRKLREDKNK